MTEIDILLRSGAAVLAGALIGLERSYRGRAAGLRTYALVALGASLLVAAAEYGMQWTPPGTGDPTRVMQGIVTGIGFLGAGVILHEGFSVRGLTTAASIWTVAAIGVVLGQGLYVVGIAATVCTWLALELLRQLENHIPTHALVHCELAFARADAWDEAALRSFVERHGFKIGELSISLEQTTGAVTYEVVMWSRDAEAPSRLARALRGAAEVVGFRVKPGRD